MSRFAAIDVAIRLQLAADGKSIDFHNVFGPAPARSPPGRGGYGYEKSAMRRFLLEVAQHLKRDTPSTRFAWRALDVEQCLDADHYMLVNIIADQIDADSEPA